MNERDKALHAYNERLDKMGQSGETVPDESGELTPDQLRVKEEVDRQAAAVEAARRPDVNDAHGWDMDTFPPLTAEQAKALEEDNKAQSPGYEAMMKEMPKLSRAQRLLALLTGNTKKPITGKNAGEVLNSISDMQDEAKQNQDNPDLRQ